MLKKPLLENETESGNGEDLTPEGYVKNAPDDSPIDEESNRASPKARFRSMSESSDDPRKLRFGRTPEEEKDEEAESDDDDEGKGRHLGASFEEATMKLMQRPCPITCQRYLNVEEFAQLFVDDVIKEAEDKTCGIRKMSSVRIIDGLEYSKDKDEDSHSSIRSVGTYVCVLQWPTIDEFTVELGQCRILEYVSYWKFKEDWKYAIIYLKGESDQTSDFYEYEVMFSIPCKQYPIPQATASVYFTIEASRVRPKHCLVDIDFRFEGHRFRHTPNNFKFQEVFLFNIIDAKLKFFKTLRF